MATYLKFNSLDEAIARSRQAWEAVLGRKKKPEDVSEFLWEVILPYDKSMALLAIDANTEARLDAGERVALLAVDSPDVRSVFDKVTAPKPNVVVIP